MSDVSRPALQSLDDAVGRLLGGVGPLGRTERLATAQALGRVLAADVVSTLDVPPADNTAMDGYALCAADLSGSGTVLPGSRRVPAGIVPAALQPGTAARIFTGAQIPAGADAVVMQEQCEAIAGDGLGAVRIGAEASVGQWIRRRGEGV